MNGVAMTQLALTKLTPSDVRVTIRDLDGRQVVWAEFDTDDQPTPLTSTSSEQFVIAANAARSQHLPLVLVLATSGADINEGVQALHAWGRVAAALSGCSGVVPTAVIV
jgi:acetyl-CoA carboxylase beta subunit